jgi:cupin superfamily acireductone dioxygenase involved in methionine salvage
MSAAVLTAIDAHRLVKLLGMLGSHHDGERAAAALMADRLVRERGLTWRDVIVMPREARDHDLDGWRAMAFFCHAHHQKLNAKECGFISGMLRWEGEPTERQAKWLIDLYLRCGGAS